jgi:Uma2 family endonuclease
MEERSDMPVAVTKRRFNVHEYHRMGEAGILHEDDRVQLIDGEVVVMASIGSRHASAVDRLNRLFSKACDEEVVRVQNPVRLGEWSEPEPDISLLRAKDDFYASAHPTPADVLLVVEVADATLRYDREVKRPLYACACVTEYWIVDLEEDAVEVYRQPGPAGYGELTMQSRGDRISPAALPDVEVSVDEILP